MRVSVLFSGGKDSSLAAMILSKIFEVELVTVSFGILSNWKGAQRVARILGFPFKVLKLDRKIIEKAAEQTVGDGYPNNGIKYLHKSALEKVARDSKLVADGTRRNDRVPILSLSEIVSLEDKFKIHYIQPLMGYSRKTINLLAEKYFEIKEYKGDSLLGAEYEFELRELIQRKYGIPLIQKIFPKDRTHSIVIKVKIK